MTPTGPSVLGPPSSKAGQVRGVGRRRAGQPDDAEQIRRAAGLARADLQDLRPTGVRPLRAKDDVGQPPPLDLRVGVDPERAGWLDSALRNLASTCAQTGHRLPPVYAALVDDEQLELLLAPARTNAPGPWAVSNEGRRWVLKRIDSPRTTGAGPAAYPALVCLGRDEQGRD